MHTIINVIVINAIRTLVLNIHLINAFVISPRFFFTTATPNHDSNSNHHRHHRHVEDKSTFFSLKTSGRTQQEIIEADEDVIIYEAEHTMVNHIPEKLVQSLDLQPLIEAVAKHTGTKRGHDALISLVQNSDQDRPKQRIKVRNLPKRNSIPTFNGAMSSSTMSRDDDKYQGWNLNRDTTRIIKLSQSLSEVQNEWQLVKEAMEIIASQKLGTGTLPPIYGDSLSPMDAGSTRVDTDDDEWLIDILSMKAYESLQLEDILKADQVLNRILKTYSWASQNDLGLEENALLKLWKDVDIAKLRELHEEIKDTVVIVKGRKSIVDPTGTKSYTFELESSRFPVISLLNQKLNNINIQIDSVMNDLLSSQKYISKMSAIGGTKDAYEWQGRTVVAVKLKDIATKMGVIRGNLDHLYLVEPREIVHLGDKKISIQKELEVMRNQILDHFNISIRRLASNINQSLDVVARTDVIFARAAFGTVLNGQIPVVTKTNKGVIRVNGFVHPILALNQEYVVPNDLLVSQEEYQRSLIITGPNFGGKTIAMKSFGLVAIMNKLGLPIPTDEKLKRNGNDSNIRVDLFHNIFVEIGDNQNVLSGDSTYSKQLKALSKITSLLSDEKHSCQSSLVLLDELGGGTDAEAGGYIGQAFLEKILENQHSITICTTHSSQLRELSVIDERFQAATVLLEQSQNFENSSLKLPSYKLSYGIVGFSNALNAAERISEVPSDVLVRAKELISSSSKRATDEKFENIIDVLEKERGKIKRSVEKAQRYRRESLQCRNAIVHMARAYNDHFSTIETRLDQIFTTMQDDDTKGNFEIIGESLSSIRLIKTKIKTVEERLRDRGLRLVNESDVFRGGESVSIIDGDDVNGEMATVSLNQENVNDDELNVEFGYYFTDPFYDDEETQSTPIKIKRRSLAIWDYKEDSLWDDEQSFSKVTTVLESKNQLIDTLKSLSVNENQNGPKSTTRDGNDFTSSRQRKAASKISKKKKRRKK